MTDGPVPPNIFHLHLDICKQCRENPMDLCEKGLPLLQLACTGDPVVVERERLSPFDLVAISEGHSPEEAAKLKAIGKEIFGGAFARFL